MSNHCERCSGKRTIKVVDTSNAYQFKDVPCPDCKGTGYALDVPIVGGMYLCDKCGRRKYDYKYFGLQCTVCDVEKIKAEVYAKWRAK